jgi:hypothetical protein
MKTKRKKLTNFLKLGILFFGISLLLFNCEQRELTEEIETVSIDNKYQSLTMEDATGFLNNFKSKGYSKKSIKGINLDIDINSLNLEEVENSDLSMPVFGAITKHIDIESKVFLIKINDSLQGFLINRIPEKDGSSSKFSGVISVTDLEGRFINGYRVEDDIFITQFVKKNSSKNSNFSARMYDAEDPEDCDESLDPSSDFCDQTLDEILIRADGGSNNSNTGLSFGSDSNSWGFQSFSFPNTGSGGSVRGPSSSSNSANVFPCDDPIHGCDKMPWAQLVKNLNITDQRQIDFLELKPSVVSNINNFLSQNNNFVDSKEFAKALITARINDNYDDFFNLEIFTQDPYNVWKNLSQDEKTLTSLYPYFAYKIWKNRKPAENATRLKFGGNFRNDKSDAFRHAFYNALNTQNINKEVVRLFSNAHESEVPQSEIIEKEMDLFNNGIGIEFGNDNENLDYNQLIDAIYQKIIDGELKYIKNGVLIFTNN